MNNVLELLGWPDRPRYAGLDANKNVVPCASVEEWARAFEHSDRSVARTAMLGWPRDKIVVSTVFLGIDHSFGGAEQLWFETMVFCNSFGDKDMERYATWNETVAGHKAMVAKWRWRRYYYPITEAAQSVYWWFTRTKWRVRQWVRAKTSK